MATPVVTNTWAGTLDCTTCDRKRLMADQFSKRAMELYLKQAKPLRCTQCVGTAAANERAAATSHLSSAEKASDECRICAACHKSLGASAYNKNQWNKGDTVSRCRDCVDAAVALETTQQTAIAKEKRTAAQSAIDEARKSGNALAILKAESILAALEAETVTGLKPVRMSGGRGGGGRGRSGRTISGRGPSTAAKGRK